MLESKPQSPFQIDQNARVVFAFVQNRFELFDCHDIAVLEVAHGVAHLQVECLLIFVWVQVCESAEGFVKHFVRRLFHHAYQGLHVTE